MALPKKAQGVLLRFFGVFSLIRGYNIAVLVVALYLTAHYILAPNVGLVELLLDLNLLFLVLASAATTASGYIINNFFDAAKDQINRPHKYLLEHLVSQQQQLVLYFILSLMALFFAGLVSIRAVLFFGAYIVAIVLYSSVIKRLYWLSNIFAALLVILPFFALTLYFRNFETLIFFHAGFLYALILVRDGIKDLQNLKGDWVQRYRTIPVVFGSRVSKFWISVAIVVASSMAFLLWQQPLGLMRNYFLFALLYLLVVIVLLWSANSQKAYLWLHNSLKLLILIGVCSIYWMNK